MQSILRQVSGTFTLYTVWADFQETIMQVWNFTSVPNVQETVLLLSRFQCFSPQLWSSVQSMVRVLIQGC